MSIDYPHNGDLIDLTFVVRRGRRLIRHARLTAATPAIAGGAVVLGLGFTARAMVHADDSVAGRAEDTTTTVSTTTTSTATTDVGDSTAVPAPPSASTAVPPDTTSSPQTSGRPGTGSASSQDPTPTIVVPLVDGRGEAEARAILEEDGWDIARILDEPSDEVGAGLVIRTEPPGGTEVTSPVPITLIVSSGPEPTDPDIE